MNVLSFYLLDILLQCTLHIILCLLVSCCMLIYQINQCFLGTVVVNQLIITSCCCGAISQQHCSHFLRGDANTVALSETKNYYYIKEENWVNYEMPYHLKYQFHILNWFN